MYGLLGISLVLTALLIINAGVSALMATAWRLSRRLFQRCAANTRAEILFLMRIGPPTAALIAVTALLIPSYLVFEPQTNGEFVSSKLAALAILSALGFALALWRGIHSWLSTRSLLREWLRVASPITISQVSVPTYRLSHSFPIIAVV